MRRRTGALVAGLAVAVAAVLITAAGCGAAAPGGGKPKPTVILVHGAFADLTPDPAGAPARPLPNDPPATREAWRSGAAAGPHL